MNQAHRFSLIAVAGLFLVGTISAQVSTFPAKKTWSKTYGKPTPYEGLYDLRPAADGSLMAAGFSTDPTNSGAAGWLMNVNPSKGEIISDNLVFNTLGGPVDGGGLSRDKGSLFSGRVIVDLYHKHDAWLVRVDKAGVPLWSRGFTLNSQQGRFLINDVAEFPDGSWVAAGNTSLIDRPPQRGWVVKLSSTGNILWQFEYGGGFTDHIQAVEPTADGGMVLAGWTSSSGGGSDDAWIMKLDSLGAVEWQRTIGGSDADQATNVVELSGGGYAVSGSTRSFTASGHAPWVMHLDSRGSLVWQRVVDGVWGDLQSIAETPRGGFVALGRVGETGFPTNDLWAVEFSPSGEVRWQRAYEGDSGDWGSVVLPIGKSGLILGGVWGWGFPDEDLWLVKTDKRGRMEGCEIARKTRFTTLDPRLVSQAGIAVRQAAWSIPRTFSFDNVSGRANVSERCR